MADEDDNDPLKLLREHNDRLTVLLSDEGRRELDRLVLLETLLMARLSNATNHLRKGNFGNLAERSSIPSGEIAGLLTTEAGNEVTQADEEDGFFGKVWDKCKSVANDKAKGLTKGWFGGGNGEDGD